MIKFYLKIFLIFVAFVLIISCSKDEANSNSSPQNVLSDNAFIIDTLNIITTNDDSFVANNIEYELGDIVIAAPSGNCPNGMLRKITSKNVGTNSITYETEQSNLNDAFKELHIDSNYDNIYSQSDMFRNGNQSESDGTFTLTFNNNLVIGNGVRLNGVIKFQMPSSTIKYEKRQGSSEPKLIIVKAEIKTINSSLQLSNSGNSNISVPEQILTTIDLPPLIVVIPVGPIPLPVKFKQKIVVKILPFEVNGKFNFDVVPIINATVGCKYENSSWQNLSTYSIDSASPSIFTYSNFLNNGSVNAQLTIFNPRYEISPMYLESLKAYFELPNKLNLELKASAPNYSLKYKLDAAGGIKQTFWLGGLGSFQLSSSIFEKTILEGNWIENEETVTDIDGNIYSFISIGTQKWTQKNLNVDHYSDGTLIPQVTDQIQWRNLTTGAWCYYNNDASSEAVYGKLYNWYAVKGIHDTASLNDFSLRKKLSPSGWHVPSDTEWTTLTNFLGSYVVAGGKMKSITGWNTPNTGATNSSRFTGLPGGYREDGEDGSSTVLPFGSIGENGFWWSSSESSTTDAWYQVMFYDQSFIARSSIAKGLGCSVRCIKD